MVIKLFEDGAVVLEGEYVELWDLKNGIELALDQGIHRVPINFEGQIKPVIIRRIGG